MAQRVSCTFSAGRKTRQDIAASARCAARRRAPRRVMRAKRGPRRRAATLPGRAGGAGRASARARLHAPQQAAQEAAQAGARGRRERAVQQQAEARAAGRVRRPAGLAHACPRAPPRVESNCRGLVRPQWGQQLGPPCTSMGHASICTGHLLVTHTARQRAHEQAHECSRPSAAKPV